MQIYTNLPNCKPEERQISFPHSKNAIFSPFYRGEKSRKCHYQRKFLFQ